MELIAPIGAMHNFDKLIFVDKKLGGVVGPRTYAVIPVYNDFSIGTASNSEEIHVVSSLGL